MNENLVVTSENIVFPVKYKILGVIFVLLALFQLYSVLAISMSFPKIRTIHNDLLAYNQTLKANTVLYYAYLNLLINFIGAAACLYIGGNIFFASNKKRYIKIGIILLIVILVYQLATTIYSLLLALNLAKSL